MDTVVYFYCNEWAINRETGEADPAYINCSTHEPQGEHGEVMLYETTVQITLPDPNAIAVAAIEMLKAKRQRVLEESNEMIMAIDDKVATYLALTYQPEVA